MPKNHDAQSTPADECFLNVAPELFMTQASPTFLRTSCNLTRQFYNVGMKQKEIFLSGEGDNWYLRNRDSIQAASNHDINFLVRNFSQLKNRPFKFLEIGCSNGVKTEKLASELGWTGFGIDPSKIAINDARQNSKNIAFEIGTAENLPYPDKTFDFCYFAFCLYLVDRDDIPLVFDECNRVLRDRGFVAILDFDFGVAGKENTYEHDLRVRSFKQDYTQYLANLGFNIVAKESYSEDKIAYSVDPDQRYSITLLGRT
jgi:ubiquinone/menaquinone biosynthesis C-methylase UbiE